MGRALGSFSLASRYPPEVVSCNTAISADHSALWFTLLAAFTAGEIRILACMHSTAPGNRGAASRARVPRNRHCSYRAATFFRAIPIGRADRMAACYCANHRASSIYISSFHRRRLRNPETTYFFPSLLFSFSVCFFPPVLVPTAPETSETQLSLFLLTFDSSRSLNDRKTRFSFICIDCSPLLILGSSPSNPSSYNPKFIFPELLNSPISSIRQFSLCFITLASRPINFLAK